MHVALYGARRSGCRKGTRPSRLLFLLFQTSRSSFQPTGWCSCLGLAPGGSPWECDGRPNRRRSASAECMNAARPNAKARYRARLLPIASSPNRLAQIRCKPQGHVSGSGRAGGVPTVVFCLSRFGQLIKMRTSSSASSFIGTVDSPDYQNPGPPFGTVAITGGPTPSPADRRSTGRIPASWVAPGLPPGVGPQQARPEAHQMERPAGRRLLWLCACAVGDITS